MKKFSNLNDFKANSGYDIEGVWYPRVTRIVDMKAKPALLKFYANMGYDKAQLISHRSAKEGTLVHEAVEKILLGHSPTIPKIIAPSVLAFSDFIKKTPIKVFGIDHVERLVHSKKYKFAGTLDVLAEIDGDFGVLDIKTSEGIYRDYNIQTAAYFAALKDEFPDLACRWILRIDQNSQCVKCGASLRIKGGRKKIKPESANWKSNGHLFSNGFHDHYDITKLCPESDHSWGPVKGLVELRKIEDDWEKDFKAFLGAKSLWEWENHYWISQMNDY